MAETDKAVEAYEDARLEWQNWQRRAGAAEARVTALEEEVGRLKAEHLDIYDECEGVAVPSRDTLHEQVEAYRETIRLLRARCERRQRAALNTGEKP